MEILVHINKRIKSRPEVQLPLDDLIVIFNDSALSNFSFVTVKYHTATWILNSNLTTDLFVTEFQLDLHKTWFSEAAKQ